MKRYLFCFQQFGGFNALCPLIETLKENHEIILTGRDMVVEGLRNRGVKAWSYADLGWNRKEVPFSSDWLAEMNPDYIVTDTINLVRDPDALSCRYLWSMAEGLDIASIAYIDCWWAYLGRFKLPEEARVPVWPHMVATVDDFCKEQVLSHAAPPVPVKVLGSPHFQNLAVMGNGAKKEALKRARKDLGIGEHTRLITFVSQPVKRIMGGEPVWGFSEHGVLASVTAALQKTTKDLRENTHLLVLLHPEESGEQLKEMFTKEPALSFRKGGRVLDYILASELVLGMFSTLLVEALILGKLVLSVQPGLKREDMLVSNLVGATSALRDIDSLPQMIERLMEEPRFRQEYLERQKKLPLVGNSMERWKTVLESA